MKTGIHPNYKLSKVTCLAETLLKLVQLKKKSELRLVQSAIHSILVVKNSLKLVDVLIVSTKNTVLNKPDFLKNRQVFFLPVFSFP